MLDRIAGQIYCTDIVTINYSGLLDRKCSSRRRFRIQQESETTFATPRYSASALLRDNVAWRLEDQEIRLSPRTTQYPDVERRVSGHPAQSASV